MVVEYGIWVAPPELGEFVVCWPWPGLCVLWGALSHSVVCLIIPFLAVCRILSRYERFVQGALGCWMDLLMSGLFCPARYGGTLGSIRSVFARKMTLSNCCACCLVVSMVSFAASKWWRPLLRESDVKEITTAPASCCRRVWTVVVVSWFPGDGMCNPTPLG